MKTLFLIATIVFSFLDFSKAYAVTSCQPIYGGGQSCIATTNLVIDKTVLNPQTNLLVDNLGINDPKYEPGFITTFQIKVTNTGNSPFSSVEVKDIFPQFASFSSGPGTFDDNTKTLTFSVANLASNETRAFTILGRIADANSLPTSTVCVVNQALAKTNTNEVAQDNSQLCIEKKAAPTTPPTATKGGFPVLSPAPITTTPATGPEALALFALIPTLGAGLFLRKITNKS